MLITQHNTEPVLREESCVPSVQLYFYYLKGTHLVGASFLGDLKDEPAGFHIRHIPHKMSLIVMGMLLRHSIQFWLCKKCKKVLTVTSNLSLSISHLGITQGLCCKY